MAQWYNANGAINPMTASVGFTTAVLAADVLYSTGANLMLSVTRAAPPSGKMRASLLVNATFGNGSADFSLLRNGVALTEKDGSAHGHGATLRAGAMPWIELTGLTPGTSITIDAYCTVATGTTTINAVTDPTANHARLTLEDR